MKMTGEERIAAPRLAVWEALNDPAVLRQCIPGCQSLDKEGDRLLATVGIRIGPINARLAGKLAITDADPPNGYRLSGEGQGGAVGFAKGGAEVRLSAEGGATLLAYDVDAQVGGRLAQLGGPVIDATAKQLAGAFFRKFGEVVAAPPAAEPAVSSAASASGAAAAGSGGVAASAPSVPATAVAPAPRPSAPVSQATASRGSAVAWFFLAVAAAVAGFLIGHAASGASDRAALAIELLVLAVAAIGFEVGRRAGGASR
jgi:hypothetical protein